MVLLDTHVFLWHTRAARQLGSSALDLIEEATIDRECYVSAITFWEIALLGREGRILVPDSVALVRSRSLASGLLEVPIDGEIGIRSANLEGLPNDPADRIIVATALGGYKLLTADTQILRWKGQLNRVDARV